MQNGFYVYEHIRLDTMKPFYVGKGSGTRAYKKQGRNKYWHNIVRKHGHVIRIIAENLDEKLAFLVEMEKIDQLRRFGISLTNMTAGGEGMSGYVQSAETIAKRSLAQTGQKRPSVSVALKGRVRSAEHKRNISIAKTGIKASHQTRIKMSNTRKGMVSSMLGKTHTEESKQKTRKSVMDAYADGTVAAKISEKIKDKYEDKEFKQKAIDATRLALANPEVRKKMSESHKGDKNWRFGKPIPEKQKLRQIASLKARPRVKCPHCDKVLDESNAKRWHFDKCKKRG